MSELTERLEEVKVQLNANIGEQVRRKRMAAGWQIKDLAERSEVSPSFISQIEQGKGAASLSTLLHIADALDVKLTVTLDETPDAAVAAAAIDAIQRRDWKAGFVYLTQLVGGG